jgi:hypothetical protein
MEMGERNMWDFSSVGIGEKKAREKERERERERDLEKREPADAPSSFQSRG